MAPMQVSSRFLMRMLRVFLVRTEPASRKPKPAWVQQTSAQSNLRVTQAEAEPYSPNPQPYPTLTLTKP